MNKSYNDMHIRMFPDPSVSITAVKAYGTKLLTEEYGEIIDLESGCWAAVLGHCNYEITHVLQEMAGMLFHTNQMIGTEHPGALVKELGEAANFKCSYKGTFMTSGSEAVSLSVVLAELLTGREKKLCFSISNLGSARELRMPRDTKFWNDVNINDCLNCKKNITCGECGKFNSIDFSEYAAFVFEPGNSAGLVLCQPQKLIDFFVQKCREEDCLIIANEVTTGFGRTGKWFGFQHYNCFDSKENFPDLICLGKGLGNGYPVSCLLIRSNLAEATEKTNFKYVQSHTDDPLGCIVARKVVEIIEKEKLIEKSQKTGEYFRKRLFEIDGIGEIRGRGMMNVVMLNKTFKSKVVFHKLLSSGFFVGYSELYNFIHLYAPLTLSESEIDSFCSALEKILKAYHLNFQEI
ncbi:MULTISPECIES: aminotransferase class III-fold pyridoxal phosphate-dependent enzyme [unclassified Sedimentibacter]|uniref:aminotransferase class III-fold pyridoxal phosphate-dependent enzyme n=1 Tax=unclassified Sedimentibacter TaxID=2649220 RepID=UPI0027E00C9A|nr:aminotransferase class III-fold pyridoxal phosphate-dependent enzyme [Sedimentibacter sp. MB35-C1]WMJ77500.1 aminotransferase class III-fold pyridoxal phosphate-dependent enzyme [Sedimentibacter sp. MB35-C1]